MDTLLLVLDLVGTFVFALSGATAGVKRRVDMFGVLVLSFTAANVGGIMRDVLIGAVPPAALTDWRYLGVSLLAGVITFYRYSDIDRLRKPGAAVRRRRTGVLRRLGRAEGAGLRARTR